MYTFHGESRNGESIYFTLLKNRLWIAMLNLPLDKSVDGRADNISRWQISFWKKKISKLPFNQNTSEGEWVSRQPCCVSWSRQEGFLRPWWEKPVRFPACSGSVLHLKICIGGGGGAVVKRNDGKTRRRSGCWMVFAHPHTGRPGQCVRPSLGQDSRLGQPHKTPKHACENLSPESRAKAFSMGSARSFLVCANRWDHTGVEKLNPKSKNVACGLCV